MPDHVPQIRERFDWFRAAIAVVLGLALVAGLAVADVCRRVVERLKESKR
jgi:hypothetical protein